ncbi:diguanylate cyclase [Geobacillus subterraneus]|uniref:Diguanylate cyclase n=2 Tax=Geobacillus TaxID=129337 RepID=A0ABN4NH18_9BACL|nr:MULTISPECIES: dipeptidase [Geobacillus]AMX83963.1 diguanylate cyclase [Geobacillus subterraneus]KZS26754.1 diguanylate cyclase [Geobacillus subterraneus]OXB88167.1 diguanylate cyclase [Geobacillus uzenensis]WPZ19589.1 dipeptidase [Geobacillus subterraneus]
MIFDAHCDALMKLWQDRSLSFQDGPSLHVTLSGMADAGVKVQCFAIYVPETVPEEARFTAALEMVDLFFTRIVDMFPSVKAVRTKQDIASLREGEIGAMLTLEGCDAIGANLVKLKTLLRLGVASVGLTWNFPNAVADGAWEKRGAGLTAFGRQVIGLLNETKRWVDVSHLSEKAFWDVMETARFPIASHSNAHRLCPHPRNLTDEQIQALIKKDGMIGINFVPYFLTGDKRGATVADVLRHLDYVCALGGENNVGFGSDFDGITETVAGLEAVKDYLRLVNELYKHYSSSQVERFLFRNFYEHLPE